MAGIESSTSHNGRHTDDTSDETGESVEGVEASATSDDVAMVEPDVAGATDGTGEPDYLGELAAAMRGVASRERDRLTARAADDAAREIGEARERGASEAQSIRRIADEDVASIEAWADSEMERIRADAATRTDGRRADLDAALARHESVVQGEVDSVEAALAGYDASLAAFMTDLDAVNDPTEIARRAGQLPARPDLGRIRADARSAALDRIAAEAVAAAALAGDADVAMESDADDIDAVTDDEPPMIEVAASDETEPAETADAAAASIEAEPAETVDAIAASAVGEAPSDEVAASTAPDAEADDAPSLVGVMDLGSMIDDLQPPVAIGPDGWDARPDTDGRGPSSVAELSTWDTGVAVVAEPTGWETETIGAPTIAEAQATADDVGTAADSGTPQPVATTADAQGSSFGPTNAAVRLLRSVAPWTAPSHKEQGEPH